MDITIIACAVTYAWLSALYHGWMLGLNSPFALHWTPANTKSIQYHTKIIDIHVYAEDAVMFFPAALFEYKTQRMLFCRWQWRIVLRPVTILSHCVSIALTIAGTFPIGGLSPKTKVLEKHRSIILRIQKKQQPVVYIHFYTELN